MLDEEAKQNIQSDIQAQHKLEQEDMQAARLKQVNLEINQDNSEESKEHPQVRPIANNCINASNTEPPSILNENTHSVTNASNKVVPDDQIDYKAKIHLFIEMQKLKLVSEAVMDGISEATVYETI